MRRDLLVTFFGSGSVRSSRNRSQEMNRQKMGDMQARRLPKEGIVKPLSKPDWSKEMYVEGGGLRHGNDNRKETRSGTESKEIRQIMVMYRKIRQQVVAFNKCDRIYQLPSQARGSPDNIRQKKYRNMQMAGMSAWWTSASGKGHLALAVFRCFSCPRAS